MESKCITQQPAFHADFSLVFISQRDPLNPIVHVHVAHRRFVAALNSINAPQDLHAEVEQLRAGIVAQRAARRRAQLPFTLKLSKINRSDGLRRRAIFQLQARWGACNELTSAALWVYMPLHIRHAHARRTQPSSNLTWTW